MVEPGALRVVTFNLLNDLTFWDERAPLIVEHLAALAPDLIALQEVSLPSNNAAWLAGRLGGYSVHLCPKTGQRSEHEALAILSRLPVEDHATLAFGKQGRVAQRVVLRHGADRWTFCNAHLHWSLRDDRARRRQIFRLLDWLAPHAPTVVCGDFNAMPHYLAMEAMRQRFTSAQTLQFGAETHATFPTPLKRGPGVRHKLRSTGFRILGPLLVGGNDGWRNTLDYIFVDHPAVRVLHCDVALNQPAPHDPALYPSDHVALLADLTLAER